MTGLRVLTNSERGTFACQRRWRFKYLDGLTTKDSSAPLRQGSLGHECIAAWYLSGGTMTVGDITERVIDPWLERREEWCMEHLPPEVSHERIAEDIELANLTIGIVTGYIETWRCDFARYDIVLIEGQIAREVPGVGRGGTLTDMPLFEDGHRRKRKWVFGGAVDGLLRDKQTGLYWLLEHKHTTETDLEKYCRKLDWDPQSPGYGWALQNPHPAADIKEPIKVAGVLYNVMRKKIPAIPKELKNGGTSKAACDTTYDVFLQTLLQRGHNPDDFRDRLDGLRHRKFFHRQVHPFLEKDFDRFELELQHQAAAIKDASRHDHHHLRQFSVCTGFQGIRCEFEDICHEYDGDWHGHGFRIKNIRHEELTGDLAESTSKERGIKLGSPEEQARRKDQDDSTLALTRSFMNNAQTPTTDSDPFDGF